MPPRALPYELGTLENDQLADVIIVGGDRLTDIQSMRNVTLVIKGGEIANTSRYQSATRYSGWVVSHTDVVPDAGLDD